MVSKLFGALNLLLITILVFFGVTLFYGIITAHLEEAILLAELEKNAAKTQGGAASQGGLDTGAKQRFSAYQPIIQRDLFRTKTAEATDPTTAETNIDDLEKTRLKLKLWGTITGDFSGAAYAVIEDASNRQQPQQLYREGEPIANASIKMILREKVVLTVDGKDEILEMESVTDQAGVATSLEDIQHYPDQSRNQTGRSIQGRRQAPDDSRRRTRPTPPPDAKRHRPPRPPIGF